MPCNIMRYYSCHGVYWCLECVYRLLILLFVCQAAREAQERSAGEWNVFTAAVLTIETL